MPREVSEAEVALMGAGDVASLRELYATGGCTVEELERLLEDALREERPPSTFDRDFPDWSRRERLKVFVSAGLALASVAVSLVVTARSLGEHHARVSQQLCNSLNEIRAQTRSALEARLRLVAQEPRFAAELRHELGLLRASRC